MFSSLSRQLALVFIGVCVVFGVSLFTIGDQNLLSVFRFLEARMLRLDLERIGNAFSEHRRALTDQAIREGEWGAVFYVNKEGNQRYIDDIFSVPHFLATRVDLIAILDAKGTIVEGKRLTGNTGLVSLDNLYQDAFQEITRHLKPTSPVHARSGILVAGNRKYLIGIGYIQPDRSRSLEIQGFFVLGVELTQQMLDALADEVKVDFGFVESNREDTVIAQMLSKKETVAIEVMDEDTFQGIFLMSDMTERYWFSVRINKHHVFLSQAAASLYDSIILFTICSIALFVVTLSFFRYRVFKRLEVANNVVDTLNKGSLLPVGSDDEIGALISQANTLIKMLRIFVDGGFQLVIITDPAGSIIHANTRVHQLLEWSSPQLVGVNIDILFDELPEFKVPIEELSDDQDGGAFTAIIETWARAKYREAFPIEIIAVRVKFTGDVQQIFLINDVTDKKQVEATFCRSFYYDSQTLLSNRHILLVRVEENLRQWRENSSTSFAVALLEINRVQMVSNMSSPAIDHVINTIILRIQHLMDEYPGLGKLSRMMYDDFAFIIPGQASTEKLLHIASRIRKITALPIVVETKTVFPNISLGIVAKAEQYATVSDILTHLNFAVEQAKHKGRNDFVLYRHEQDEISKGQDVQLVEHEIHKALKNDEFFAFFQPIVELETARLVGFESLVRWISSDAIHRPPEYFISLAEESGVITGVDRRVIEQSVAALTMWNLVLPDLYICVNVSIRDLVESSFIDFIIHTVQEHDANPANLVLEFTENLLIVETEALNVTLTRLRESGVRIGLDDFGRRYSSLEYINQLPLTYLKMGHSFVSKIATGEKNDRIVDVIIQLANLLSLDFIAEGIETEEQLDWLKKRGCRFGQGFYFSEAISRIEANKYVKENS